MPLTLTHPTVTVQQRHPILVAHPTSWSDLLHPRRPRCPNERCNGYMWLVTDVWGERLVCSQCGEEQG